MYDVRGVVGINIEYFLLVYNTMAGFSKSVAYLFALFGFVFAAARTVPPSGAIVVRSGTTASGEFTTISAAVNSLPNDQSSRSIFIYPGQYNEQVYITRTGPLTVLLDEWKPRSFDAQLKTVVYRFMVTPIIRLPINRTRLRSRLVFPPAPQFPMMPVGHSGSTKTTSSYIM